jgi:hypothetical protein
MKPTAEAKRERDREQTWREIMARWEQTGLSQQEFCEQEQIKLSTFGYWRRELKRRDSQGKSVKPRAAWPSTTRGSSPAPNMEAPLFVPVQVSQAPSAPLCEVVLPDGLVIRVSRVCDLEPVVRLVRTLEAR